MPLATLAAAERLPCCTYVALWLLERAGHEVGSVVAGLRAGGRDWWDKANVLDPAEPWSAIAAARELHGGTTAYRVVAPGRGAPVLTEGRWHVVQRWRGLSGADTETLDDDQATGSSRGHAYLAYGLPGRQARIVQSSTSAGYRDTVGDWTGTAGLDGYTVAVLTLPASVQE